MNTRNEKLLVFQAMAYAILIVWSLIPHQAKAEDGLWQQQSVVFLGTSLDAAHHPVGVVASLQLAFREKVDSHTLNVSFAGGPGKFSPLTQVAIQESIKNVAQVAGLDSRRWEVFLTVPYPGMTIYGESLSAMVSLTVLALAKHDPLLANRVMTGKVTRDGHIGAVGGIPLKIQAAFAERIERVLIPEDRLLEDSDWLNPFLMHISPVNNIFQAYQVLTGRALSVISDLDPTHG